MRLEAIAAACATLLLAAGPARAQRDVVVVGGAITEIVYALGAQDRVAATDTTSVHPAAAANTPKVGYQRSLSTEGVLALKPRIVFAAHEAGPPAALTQIRGAGVEVVSFGQDYSIDGLRARVASVAKALGREAEGRRLNERIASEWKRVSVRVASDPVKPRVLFILAHAGPTPQGGGEGTTADAIIRLAGGVNAMAGVQGYRPLTAEGIVNAAPDVILITDQGLAAQGGLPSVLDRPGVAMTPAGKARRVVSMEALYLMGFGPRLPQAVDELATAIRKPG